MLGHQMFERVSVPLYSGSASANYIVRPPSGLPGYTLQEAYFDQVTGITSSNTAYFSLVLHQVAAAGTHTTTMSTTLTFETQDHTGYVQTDFTLSDVLASRVIDDGEGVEVVRTMTGSPTALGKDAHVDLIFLPGTGKAQ